jgi:hypothetical protein
MLQARGTATFILSSMAMLALSSSPVQAQDTEPANDLQREDARTALAVAGGIGGASGALVGMAVATVVGLTTSIETALVTGLAAVPLGAAAGGAVGALVGGAGWLGGIAASGGGLVGTVGAVPGAVVGALAGGIVGNVAFLIMAATNSLPDTGGAPSYVVILWFFAGGGAIGSLMGGAGGCGWRRRRGRLPRGHCRMGIRRGVDVATGPAARQSSHRSSSTSRCSVVAPRRRRERSVVKAANPRSRHEPAPAGDARGRFWSARALTRAQETAPGGRTRTMATLKLLPLRDHLSKYARSRPSGARWRAPRRWG